ncbi:MAG: hypothetical protein HOO96_00530 [Polyangiaceae bacterium]|nr:hypothetical protein [Polyangiaceae bacterium]
MEIPAAQPANLVLQPVQPLALYRPESFRLIEQGDGDNYEAAVPPSRLATLPLLFFTLFWDGFMVMWYGIAIAKGIWPMALFGLLHLGVGIFLSHKVLVGMFNTPRLRIADGRMKFTNGPIPAAGRLDAPVADVDAFAVVEGATSSRSGTTTTFSLVANMGNGTSKTFALFLPDRACAEYVAQRFNAALAEAKTRALPSPYRS